MQPDTEQAKVLAAALRTVELQPVTLGPERDGSLGEFEWQAAAILAASPQLRSALELGLRAGPIVEAAREFNRRFRDPYVPLTEVLAASNTLASLLEQEAIEAKENTDV